jgi:hypothetical protein
MSGSWKTGGFQPEEGSTEGKFTITMTADNKTRTGTIIGRKWLNRCTNNRTGQANRSGNRFLTHF